MDSEKIQGAVLLILILLSLILYIASPNKHERELMAQGIRPRDLFDELADLKDFIISTAKKIYRNHIKGKNVFSLRKSNRQQ